MAERERTVDNAKGVAETAAVMTVAALVIFAFIAAFVTRR